MLKITIEMTEQEWDKLSEEYANEDVDDTSFTEMAWAVAEKVLIPSKIERVEHVKDKCQVCGLTGGLEQVEIDGKTATVCNHCLFGEI